MKIKLKNKNIYTMALELQDIKGDFPELPVSVGFYIQKNLNLIGDAAAHIEEYRNIILMKYGTTQGDNGEVFIPEDLRIKAQAELNDLAELEQEIDLHLIKLASFKNISMSTKCLSAITFMIEENYPDKSKREKEEE